jgi:hypothetical protein
MNDITDNPVKRTNAKMSFVAMISGFMNLFSHCKISIDGINPPKDIAHIETRYDRQFQQPSLSTGSQFSDNTDTGHLDKPIIVM